MSTLEPASRTFNNVDNHVVNLYRYVSDLFDVNNVNNKFSDVQLKIESKTFYCHKFVLSLCSKYFANLSFLPNTVTQESINPDHFYDVLQFMYTGQVILTTNNVMSLLAAAENLGIDALTKACTQFLDDVLNTENALSYWQKTNKNRFTKNCQTLVIKLLNCFDSETIKLILSDDNLEVKSEVEVCEMLMKWLQVQTDAGHEVHADQLLPLIRWSGISVDYVKSKLLQNKTLTSDPASISFLTKVMAYLLSGAQFEGLQTLHRPSTGLENCLMIIGLGDGYTTSSEVCPVSLQHRDRKSELLAIPTKMFSGTVACLSNNNVYVTGVGDTPCNETWTWNIASGWRRCADMLTGRRYHCSVVVNSMLYVLGGRVYTAKTTLSSVECYNIKPNKWSSAGQLIYAVREAACVTYKNSLYVFGRIDKYDNGVDHVQVYNPAHESCTLLDTRMPGGYSHMRAVLWETAVILLSHNTCLIYNFETQTWQEREQFKTSVEYFASTLDNSTIYIAGGGKRDTINEVWTVTDEVKSVSVLDLIQDKPAVWKHHAKLTKPALIHSFINISLPLYTKCSMC